MAYLIRTDLINDTGEGDISSNDDGSVVDRFQKNGHFFAPHSCINELVNNG